MINRTENYLYNDNFTNNNKTNQNENVFIPYSQSNTNSYFKVVSPQYEGRKSFYSRVNTSPVKRRSEEGVGNDCTGKTLVKITLNPNKDNKENDFLSPNSQSNSFNRFTSNSHARNQVRYLISEGKYPEAKPSLNTTESRNQLIDFSKKKVFSEDIIEEDEGMKKTKCTREDEDKEREVSQVQECENDNSQEEEECTDEMVEEDYEEEQARKQRLSEIERKLPVPINRKNDEKFKILKMREMRRESLPSNKSAKTNDLQYTPYEKSFVSEFNYALCKKKKMSHSAKRKFSTLLTLVNPKKKNDSYKFPVYRDNEIGLNEYWQAPLIESKADEDIPTDNEQLTLAAHYTVTELQEAFEIFLEKGPKAMRNRQMITFKDGSTLREE